MCKCPVNFCANEMGDCFIGVNQQSDDCNKEKRKMPTNIPIKNTNQINQIKVVTESATTDPKTKVKSWHTPVVTYLKPGEQTDIWIAEGRRTTIVELPT